MDALIVVVTALCTFSGQKVGAAGSIGREDGKWNDFAAGLSFGAVDALKASFQVENADGGLLILLLDVGADPEWCALAPCAKSIRKWCRDGRFSEVRKRMT